MASEQEIEALIVRMIGDGSDFQNMLVEASSHSEEAARHVEEAANRIEGFGEKLEGFAHKAVSALKATAEFEFLAHAFEAFEGREQTMLRLSAAIDVNGRAVESTTAQYKAFAAETAHSSLSTAEDTLKLLAKAEAYNLTGEAAEKAVKGALAIAAVNETEASATLRLTAALAKGDIEQAMHMARLVPQLRGVTNEQEFLEKAQKLTEVGMKTMELQSKSSEGAVHHLGAAWRGLQKDLGEVVAAGAKPAIEALTSLMQIVRSMPDWLKTSTVAIIAMSAAVTTLGLAIPLVTSAVTAAKASIMVFGASLLANPMTAWVVVVGAAIAAIYALGAVARSQLSAVKDFNMELELSGQLRNKLVSQQTDRTAGVLKGITGFKGSREDKQHLVKDQLALAEKNAQGYERELKRINEEQEKMGTFFTSGSAMGQKWKTMNQEIEQTKSLLDVARNSVTALKAEMEKISDKELLAEIGELSDKLFEQIDTFGMTAEEAERYALKQKGATDQQLEAVDKYIHKLAELKKAEEIESAVDKTIGSLREQIDTFGMSSEEAEVYKLKLMGASDTQIEMAASLERQLSAMNDWQAAMDEGEKVTEDNMSKHEKFQREQEKLNDLLAQGAITAETYARAIVKAADDTTALAHANGVLAGSADAIQKRQDQKDRLSFAPYSEAFKDAGKIDGAAKGSAAAAQRHQESAGLLRDIREAVRKDKPTVKLNPTSF